MTGQKKTQERRGKKIPFGEMSFAEKKDWPQVCCRSDKAQSLENRVWNQTFLNSAQLTCI